MNCSTVIIASCAGEIPGAPRVPYVTLNASSWYQAPSSSRARIASDPFRNARLATLAVPAGTSGHGRGCIDMMTRFCGREQEQGKAPAATRTIANITTAVQEPAWHVEK